MLKRKRRRNNIYKMTAISIIDFRRWSQSIIVKPDFMSKKVGSARYDLDSLAYQECYFMLLTASGLISNTILTHKELDQIEYDMILSGNRLGDILKSKDLINTWVWIWSIIDYWLSEAIDNQLYETCHNLKFIINRLYENNVDEDE